MIEKDRGGQVATGPAACKECGCDVEWCSFCDGEDCRVALCYDCTIRAVGASRPAIHEHGG